MNKTPKAKMPTIEHEFANSMREYDNHRRKRAIKALFERDSLSIELRDFNYIIRAFCWLKTLVCLLLNRTKGSYLGGDSFCILAYDEYQCYESISWESVWVSSKLLKGWQVCIFTDGT